MRGIRVRKISTGITGLWLCLLAGLASATNVDILMLLDKNGADYTLQQTVSPHAVDGQAASVTITLRKGVENPEIIFVGPGRQKYTRQYLSSVEKPSSFTISSGSVIIRYQHSLDAPANRKYGASFEFLLSAIAPQIQISGSGPVLHSASIVLPTELEFAFAEAASLNSERTGNQRRSISIRSSGKQNFQIPVRYRLVDQDRDGVGDSIDLCPGSQNPSLVDKHGCEPDADADSITDILDLCPGSTVGASVDEHGCEADTDQDGVPDRYDQCDDTPADFAIAENGCNLDSDNDGIADSLDQCTNSEPGEPVSTTGCSLDFDNDGVPNYRDQCKESSQGRAVDVRGCETDSDADGLPDRLDVCVNSPANIEVDDNGCAVDRDNDKVPDYRDICLAEAAQQSLKNEDVGDDFGCATAVHSNQAQSSNQGRNHGRLLSGVQFSDGSAYLSADSRRVLDRVARAISHHQSAVFEIAAHTDNAGKAAFNQRLSQDRAETVRQYLMIRGVSPNKIIAKGYGETAPLRANTTDKNRALNRRIELRKIAR